MSNELTPWLEPDPPDTDVIDKALGMHALDAATAFPELATWTPQTLGAAEWAMARLARATAAYEEINVEAVASVERIIAWRDDAQRRLGRDMDFFSAGLERYARIRRKVTGQATTKLPSGQVKTREVHPKLVVHDPEALVLWLEGNEYEDAIKTERTPLVSQLGAYVRIVEEVVGYRAVCGDGTWREFAGAGECPVAVGEVLDGKPVAAVESITQAQVVDNNGRAVPGLSAEDGYVRATASPSPTTRAGVTIDRRTSVLDH